MIVGIETGLWCYLTLFVSINCPYYKRIVTGNGNCTFKITNSENQLAISNNFSQEIVFIYANKK